MLRTGFVLLAAVVATGCAGKPKREMRPPAVEEMAIPPASQYTQPADIPRDKPLLTPKAGNPGLPGLGGGPTSGMNVPNTGMMPGGASPGGPMGR